MVTFFFIVGTGLLNDFAAVFECRFRFSASNPLWFTSGLDRSRLSSEPVSSDVSSSALSSSSSDIACLPFRTTWGFDLRLSIFSLYSALLTVLSRK